MEFIKCIPPFCNKKGNYEKEEIKMQITQIEFLKIRKNQNYIDIIEKVVQTCFKVEKLEKKKLSVSIILTTPEEIRKTNQKYRNIDKETDVLSFPIFEKEEIKELTGKFPETLGDIMISVERVKKQAEEYGHSFERELSYMLVHGFYHLLGYDHIEEEEKKQMRQKEEYVLNLLNIKRDSTGKEG